MFNSTTTTRIVQAFPSIYLKPLSALKSAYIRVLKDFEYNFLTKKTEEMIIPVQAYTDDEKENCCPNAGSEEEGRKIKCPRV